MAKKKERNAILEELGYTKEDMKAFWKECVKTGVPAIVTLDKAEYTWKDLTADQIRQLPTLKETYLANVAAREQSEAAQLANRAVEILDEFHSIYEAQNQNTESNETLSWDKEILQKIDNQIPLSEGEIQELVFNCNEVSREDGENRRWSRTVESVVEICGRFFMIEWEEGLTECQENNFYEQPYEVEKREYEKTVIVTEWYPANKDKELSEESDFPYMNPPEEEDELEL